MADANLHLPVQTSNFVLSATPPAKWHNPMTPFDARCAADAQDNRNIITTVNQGWIPAFPRILGREIVTYEDGLWGPQEYTRWPQLYNERCIHHACIPRYASDFFPGCLVYEGFGYGAWEPSDKHGVVGFGFLNSGVLAELSETTSRVLRDYESAERAVRVRTSASSDLQLGIHQRLGRTLCLLVRNALDRLRLLPTTEQHALVAGRMVHRLLLELSGLVVYYNVVSVRISSTADFQFSVLNVLGAFVRNAATAQLFHRVGLPFWLIQPWTPDITICKVVTPRRWSSELSNKPASPRIPKSWYDPDGTHQDPGRWTHPSVIFVCNSLCSSALPRLQPVLRSEDDEREAKRFKGESASTSLLPGPKTAQSQPHSAKKRGTRSRGSRAGAQTKEPHASTTHKSPPSNLVAISPNWESALTRVSPLPSPPPMASVYYLPPPYLILDAPTHRTRYIHNFTRIHEFCRHRLVDSTINGAPLRIVEWRHALYGDYRLDATEGPGYNVAGGGADEELSKTKGRGPQYDRSQAVRGLFARCGGLQSYDATCTWKYRKLDVSMSVAERDEHLLALVVWDLHESNWRCELRALDDRLVGHSDDAFRKWEREQVIANVWRSGEAQSAFSALNASSPEFVWTRVGQPGWKKRRANLHSFLRVMSAWPKYPEFLRMNGTTVADCDDEWLFNQVELCAINFYVDSFVGQYHRLPLPPVQLVHCLS